MITKTANSILKCALVAAFAIAVAGGTSYAVDSYYDGMASRNPSLTGEMHRGTAVGAAKQAGSTSAYGSYGISR